MSSTTVLSFEELLDGALRSAVHLEMRDSYAVADEADDFARWQATGQRDLDPDSAYWKPWLDLVARTVARGVTVRRARIVSEPVSAYIRYEHAGAVMNLGAGELVRWLPRRQAADIALPGADFWLIDERLVRWNHFDGNGDWADPPAGLSEDPKVVKLCATAFEAVWNRGVPHDQYHL